MARVWTVILMLGLLPAAAVPAEKADSKQQKEAEPPEEDVSAMPTAPKEYSFNPIQAAKEIQVGNFYTKRGAWRSARIRYEEATKWDPTSAEAWYRLADACDRTNEAKKAREAWAKYLELAPDGKYASNARKRLGSKK